MSKQWKLTRAKNALLCAITALTVGACAAQAATITVDDDGPADYDNIHDAMAAASYGDEILVEPGTYFQSTYTLLGGPVQVGAYMKNGVRLASTSGPGVTKIRAVAGFNPTIGVYAQNCDGKTEIDGFTIESVSYGSAFGYGAWIWDGTPVFKNCRINQADGASSASVGIKVDQESAQPVFEDGELNVENGVQLTSSGIIVRRSVIEGAGTGIGRGFDLTANLENVLISDNTIMGFDEGIYIRSFAFSHVAEPVVDGNIIRDCTYGVYVTPYDTDESATITNNTFYENDYGILLNEGSPNIERNIFTECIGGVYASFSGVAPYIACNNAWNNSFDYGTWVDPGTSNNNFYEDPLFCDTVDFELYSNSGCTAFGSPCNQLVGAKGVGCLSGGSCPYVYAFDGTGFVEENTVLAAVPQELAGMDEADVKDLLVFETELQPEDGLHKVEIREFEQEHSYFDKVQLVAFDLEPGEELGVLPNGKAFAYRDRLSPVRAWDEGGRDVLPKLLSEDGEVVRGAAGSSIFLEFAAQNGNPIGDIIGIVSGIKHDNGGRPDGAESGISIWNGATKVGGVSPRELLGTAFVGHSAIESLVDQDRLVLRVEWNSRHDLDQVSIFTVTNEELTGSILPPVYADHSKSGSSVQAVAEADGSYAELSPGETLSLAFAATATDGRSVYALALEGHYYRLPVASTGSETGLFGPGVKLTGSAPNPFRDETNIRFNLASHGPTRVAIHDVAGRLVRVLHDGELHGGSYELTWDGRTESGEVATPSVYYYSLDHGGHRTTGQVTLIR